MLERRAQRGVDLRHRRRQAEIAQARHAEMALPDSARRDAAEMRQVRRDIERHAVKRRPAPDPDADGGDLVLRRLARGAKPSNS